MKRPSFTQNFPLCTTHSHVSTPLHTYNLSHIHPFTQLHTICLQRHVPKRWPCQFNVTKVDQGFVFTCASENILQYYCHLVTQRDAFTNAINSALFIEYYICEDINFGQDTLSALFFLYKHRKHHISYCQNNIFDNPLSKL